MVQVNDTLDPRSTVVLLGIVVTAEEEGPSTVKGTHKQTIKQVSFDNIHKGRKIQIVF